MAIALEGTPVESLEITPATSQTVALPTGVTSGELLVIALIGTDASKTWSATGWTAVQANSLATVAHMHGFLYKISDGGEGTSVTVSVSSGTSGLAAVAARFSGVDNADPTHSDNVAYGNVGSSQSSWNIAASTLTGITSGNGVLVIADAEATRNVTTLDGDLTEVQDVVAQPSINFSIDFIVAGTTNPQYDYVWNDSRDYDYALLEVAVAGVVGGRIMSSLAGFGGLAGPGGIAGPHGGLAG